MQTIDIPIIRGDKATRDTDYTDYLPKNMVAVAKEIKGSAGYLISHDGLKQISTAFGVDRGGIFNDRQNMQFRVSGSTFCRVNSDGSATSLGSVSGGGQVTLAYSFNNQLVIAGGNAYVYNTTAGFRRITDADIGNPIDACWIDNYFFYTDGEFLYHSKPTDETQVEPLDYAVAEIMPDRSYGVMTTQDNLVAVFGRYSVEYFVNDGSTEFAFSRIQQKSVSGGIVGTHAKCTLGGQIFGLGGRVGESPYVFALGAGNLQPISTRSIDKIIAEYSESELGSVVMETRTDLQDQFIIIRLPRHTLLFNASVAQSVGIQNAWATLSYGVSNGVWLGANGVFDPRLNKWVYGSALNSKLYLLDKETSAQDGQPTECQFGTPLIPAENVRISKIELNTISGFNADNTAVFVSMSDDGITESSEWFNMYGDSGEYSRRFIIRRFGYVAHEFSFRFRSLSKEKLNFSRLEVTLG